MKLKIKVQFHGKLIAEVPIEGGQQYTFGRDAACTVRLEGQSAISRTHFRILEEDGQWVANVISKFGELVHDGKKTRSVPITEGASFKLYDYEFNAVPAAADVIVPIGEASEAFAYGNEGEEENQGQIEPARNAAHLVRAVSGDSAVLVPADSVFEGNDETTRMIEGASISGYPYLRIVESSGVEESVKLDGKKWIAGRDEGCDILINTRKASRRQFELLSTPQGYFIRDLGSSNGTLLNGLPLAHDELKAIRSGDVIQVGTVVAHFEIRDPSFQKKLMVLNNAESADRAILVANPYEMINYPVAAGPGGAVRVDGGDQKHPIIRYALGDDLEDDKAKKKRKLMLIAIAVLLPLILIGLMDSSRPPAKPKTVANPAFELLSPTSQQRVKELYVLSKNEFMQSKLALAADDLKKLHDILPEGYENSISMAADCKAAKDQQEALDFIAREQAKQAENKRIVDKNLKDCEQLANTTYEIAALNDCLAPANERDPANPAIQEFISRVQHRIEQRDLEMAKEKNYSQLVAKGRALYKRAKSLEEAGEGVDAVHAYHTHIESRYPDPEGLKSVSQKNVVALMQRISTRIDEELKLADQAFQQGHWPDAMTHIKNAKKLDPSNEKTAEMNAKYRKQIYQKLRQEYEDSVIAEGLGDVDQAKKAWHHIIEMDLPGGEYYKKAHDKLRSYGAQ